MWSECEQVSRLCELVSELDLSLTFFPSSRRGFRYFVLSALDICAYARFEGSIYWNLRELSLYILYVKVHLTPLSQIHLLFESFGWNFFLICLNPQFSMPFHCRAWSVAQPSFRESRVVVADDIYQGTKHNGVSSLYLLEKMESKTNRSKSFVSESYLFRHRSSELNFDSKGEKDAERLRNKLLSSTFDKCELTA